MAHVRATADAFLSGRGIAVLSVIGLAAFALASGAAAWMHESDLSAPVFNRGSDQNVSALAFEDRFSPRQAAPTGVSPRALVQSVSRDLKAKLDEARSRLSQDMQSQMRLAMLTQSAGEPAPSAVEPAPSTLTAIPLPRPRPTEATLNDLQTSAAAQAYSRIPQPTDRTLLQKLSDLIPPRITLASLNPEDGISGTGPDLAALGYDGTTAVYDISARAVYMPNGAKLEAHSGLGSLMDDPRYVDRRDVGATPPSVYDLKPRSSLFHGVQALRMIPVGSTNGAVLGRTGLLTHPYMLGPSGDSNGCVSIKNYDKFLKAYENGEVKRLVVVANMETRDP